MERMDRWKDLLILLYKNEIFVENTKERLFNQYKDNNKHFDSNDANNIRQGNLINYILSFDQKPRFLLVGEACGFYGCRFSGIPFTCEQQLLSSRFFISGKKSSNDQLSPFKERSATTFWSILEPFHQQFYVHNTVPFHPYSEELYENRTPTMDEIETCLKYLEKINDVLEPELIIAIGKKAETAIKEKLNVKNCVPVRHPSYGGKNEFITQIKQLFGLKTMKKQEKTFW